MNEYLHKQPTREEFRNDGRQTARKTVADDKLTGVSSIAPNTITQAMMQSNSVGTSQLKTEIATLAFGSGDTSKTAVITNGDLILGFYVSAISGTPAFADLLLGISGTTLTGTRASAPGGITTITYSVVLLKA